MPNSKKSKRRQKKIQPASKPQDIDPDSSAGGNNLDGVIPPPKPKPIVRIDWDSLEREFILNADYPSVQTWFREFKGWNESQTTNGNFFEKTMGWGSKRADFQQKITEEAIDSAKQVEKERIPKLMTAKLNLVAQIMGEVTEENWKKLTVKDKKLIYEIVKNELGEPTHQGTRWFEDEDKNRIPILGIIGVVDGRVRTDNGASEDRQLKEKN